MNAQSLQWECFFFTGTRNREFHSREEFLGLAGAARSFALVHTARVLLSRSVRLCFPKGGPVNEETLT